MNDKLQDLLAQVPAKSIKDLIQKVWLVAQLERSKEVGEWLDRERGMVSYVTPQEVETLKRGEMPE